MELVGESCALENVQFENVIARNVIQMQIKNSCNSNKLFLKKINNLLCSNHNSGKT